MSMWYIQSNNIFRIWLKILNFKCEKWNKFSQLLNGFLLNLINHIKIINILKSQDYIRTQLSYPILAGKGLVVGIIKSAGC